MKLIILFLFLFSFLAFPKKDTLLDIETKIVSLEKNTQNRLEKLLTIALDRKDLFVNVDLQVMPRSEFDQKNSKSFDYLPLLANGTVPKKLEGYAISGFKLTVLSKQGFSDYEKTKVREIIQGVTNSNKVDIEFSKLIESDSSSFLQDLWKDFSGLKLLNWLAYGMVLFGLYYGFIRFRMHLRKIESKVDDVHQYNISELIKFIKSHLDKNENILKQVLRDDRNDIIGFKGLVPFIDIYFKIPELVSPPYLYSVAQEEEFHGEKEFYFWMKDLSERITHFYLKGIPEAVIDSGKNAKCWPLEDLSLIPSLYLIRKLRSKSEAEVVAIIEGLSDGQKYFMIKHIDESFSTKVLEKIKLSEPQSETVELKRFLQEIQADFERNEFDIEGIKKAS